MKEERETKRLLLESAKAEFMEKGFEKASLRTICKNAGVTTGALYFFFNNKEDLFTAIVEEPYNMLLQKIKEHYDEHKEIFLGFSSSADIEPAFLSEQHDSFEYDLVNSLYENYDAFLLIVEKSQGTRFEGCIDTIVELTEKSYVFMAEKMAKMNPGYKVNEYMCHWLTHISIDAFIHLLTHVHDKNTALKYVKKMIDFMLNGWIDLVLIEDK